MMSQNNRSSCAQKEWRWSLVSILGRFSWNGRTAAATSGQPEVLPSDHNLTSSRSRPWAGTGEVTLVFMSQEDHISHNHQMINHGEIQIIHTTREYLMECGDGDGLQKKHQPASQLYWRIDTTHQSQWHSGAQEFAMQPILYLCLFCNTVFDSEK